LLVEDEMVALSIHIGRSSVNRYRPGQYLFLQVPSLARFQWHPFTISTISDESITLHIRTTAGDWTSMLGKEARLKKDFAVAIDGPFGSPSREFYRYDRTIILGAGIGITPFSAILFDLLAKLNLNQSPWKKDQKSFDRLSRKEQCSLFSGSLASSTIQLPEGSHSSNPNPTQSPSVASSLLHMGSASTLSTEQADKRQSHLSLALQKRSIALHWVVRDSNDLQWLSHLLHHFRTQLEVQVQIHLHVTKVEKDEKLSTTIFRTLLDHHRIESIQDTSFLTGLYQTCHFQRPDFQNILHQYHCESSSALVNDSRRRPASKIGVIYCGPASLGSVLSRECQSLTTQARADGSHLQYHYHSESF
jgi:hypothetical protein